VQNPQIHSRNGGKNNNDIEERVQARKLQKYALQQNGVIAETKSNTKRQFTKP
jgi:hypothetical protein